MITLKLSTLWGFHTTRSIAIARLDKLMGSNSPATKLMIARTFGVTDWVLPSIRTLILRRNPLLFKEARRIGFSFAIQIYAAREEVRNLQKANTVALLLKARETAPHPQKCPLCGTILGSSFWFGSMKNTETNDATGGPTEGVAMAFTSKAVENMFFEAQGVPTDDKQLALPNLIKNTINTQPGAVVAMSAVAFASTNISRDVASGTSKCCSGTGSCMGACFWLTMECIGESICCLGKFCHCFCRDCCGENDCCTACARRRR